MDVTITERAAWWRWLGAVFAAIAIAGFTLTAAPGCAEDGPAEEAGEAVDEAAEDVGEAIDDAVD